MLEAVDLVKAGKAPRTQQDHSKATYEGWCAAENAHIDWAKPWSQIHNLIRGCNPAPGAWTTLNGAKLQCSSRGLFLPTIPRASVGRWARLLLLTRTDLSWLVPMDA